MDIRDTDDVADQPEDGCFVFQMVNGGLGVRNRPGISDASRTGAAFAEGDLVSVDRILPSRYALGGPVDGGTDMGKSGPFLRLSEDSGWIFQNKFGKACARRVDVRAGFWAVFVDDYPGGIAPRRHLIDRGQENAVVSPADGALVHRPMRKLHCDRKVVHPDTGVGWCRVQGTKWWAFDRRPGDPTHADVGQREDHHMLRPDDHVEVGAWAYTALIDLEIRCLPDAGYATRTGRTIRAGEIVIVDFIRKSPFYHGNGPFLFLADGSGWLFEKKFSQPVMRRVAINKGRWAVRVLNSPAGIAPRRHPIDDATATREEDIFRINIVHEPGSVVECDRKITSASGVNFYRVETGLGKGGWIIDKRDCSQMLELVPSQPPWTTMPFTECEGGEAWTVEFVRNVAASVSGLREILLNETSRLISFRINSDDSARVNVYYTTRTVGTALNHPNKGKTQLFRRNCSVEDLIEIFRNPRVHTGKGYKRKLSDISIVSSENEDSATGTIFANDGAASMFDAEEECRYELLEMDKDAINLQRKRTSVLRKVRAHDDIQKQSSVRRQNLIDQRNAELELIRKSRQEQALQQQQQQYQQQQLQQQQLQQQQLQQQRDRTCAVCIGQQRGPCCCLGP